MSDLDARDYSYRGVRAAVLGAAGFIGRWVAKGLSAQGAKLTLIVRDRVSAERIFEEYSVRGELIELDLRRREAVRGLFKKIRPSITFNLAGYGVDPSERDEGAAYSINTRLPQSLCEVLAETRDSAWPGQDIVHAGSALEYGGIGGDLVEDSSPQPTTLYGKSKLAGTEALARCCRAYMIKGVTARLFTVYGPGEHDNRLLPSLLSAARAGGPIELTDGRQMRDFTYVADVADGLLRLGVSRLTPGEVINLATGRLTPVRQFVELAAEVLNIPGDKLLFGVLPTRAEEMNHLPVSVERLKRLTAWVPPTDLLSGIRKTSDHDPITGVANEHLSKTFSAN